MVYAVSLVIFALIVVVFSPGGFIAFVIRCNVGGQFALFVAVFFLLQVFVD